MCIIVGHLLFLYVFPFPKGQIALGNITRSQISESTYFKISTCEPMKEITKGLRKGPKKSKKGKHVEKRVSHRQVMCS